MRYYPPVPDNAFTRLVARVGGAASLVALVAFGLLVAIFTLGALIGVGAAILGIPL